MHALLPHLNTCNATTMLQHDLAGARQESRREAMWRQSQALQLLECLFTTMRALRAAVDASPEPAADDHGEDVSAAQRCLLVEGAGSREQKEGIEQMSGIVWRAAERVKTFVSKDLEGTEPRAERALLIEGALADLYDTCSALIPWTTLSA